MRRLVSGLLAFILLVSLSACDFRSAKKLDRENDNASDRVANVTEEDATKMVDLVAEIANLEKLNKQQQDIKKYLEGLDWVEVVSETEDGGLTCVTEFGVTGVWTPGSENTISGDDSVGSTTILPKATITANNAYDVDSIAVLCPYASVDSRFKLDGYNFLGQAMNQYTDCEVSVFKDEEVSIDLLKNLDKFDMVWFYSHGTLSNVFNSAWEVVDCDPYTMTGEFANSPQAYMLLSSDFFFGRTVVDLSDGRIGVGGNFYRHYYTEDQLEGVFFHFASCNSMRSDTLAQGLLSRGAAWVEGWTNKVTFDNDFMHFTGVIHNLLEGDTIGQAIIDADLAVKSEFDFYQENCRLKGLGKADYQLMMTQRVSKTPEQADFDKFAKDIQASYLVWEHNGYDGGFVAGKVSCTKVIDDYLCYYGFCYSGALLNKGDFWVADSDDPLDRLDGAGKIDRETARWLIEDVFNTTMNESSASEYHYFYNGELYVEKYQGLGGPYEEIRSFSETHKQLTEDTYQIAVTCEIYDSFSDKIYVETFVFEAVLREHETFGRYWSIYSFEKTA